MKMFSKKNILIMLFVVFIFLRLFIDNSSILLHSDSLKYMEAAKNFPHHTLYNNQLYLLHPPLYPYTLYFFTLMFGQDHIASIFISFISSVITFFVLYHFFMLITKNFKITFFVLLFYTLSNSLITASRIALKEALLIMLIVSSIYFYVKAVKFFDKKSLLFSALIGSFLALTSDNVVLLIPALGLTYIIFNKKKVDIFRFRFPNLVYALIPVIIILLFYGSWTLVKYVQYSNYDFYPNGHSGIPLDTRNFGLLETINPEFAEQFEGSYIAPGFMSTVKRIVFNFGYMFNLEPLSVPRGLNFTTMKYLLKPWNVSYMIFFYTPLALLTLYGFYRAFVKIIKHRKIHNNVNLYILGLFVIFVFPVTQKFVSPRYILTSYIFMFYFISYGILAFIDGKFKLPMMSKIIPVVIIILLLIIPFWFVHNRNMIFLTDKVLTAENTGEFVRLNIPEDAGIMAQPGYSANLIYQTNNRVIGLHPRPEKLEEMIDYFDIDYIVVGRYYTYDFYHLSMDSVEYVRNSHNNFELIAAIKEDYHDFYSEENPARNDEVWIYKVKRD